MKTSEFDFNLPESLIARYPLKDRSKSRLLRLNEYSEIQHHIFSELPSLFDAGDVLIFNNTKVIPARLFGQKITGGKIEILIERIIDSKNAYAHVKSNKSLHLPCRIILANRYEITITERVQELFKIVFHTEIEVKQLLQEIGTIPLPPYLRRKAEDLDHDRYQTIYATKEGAVAAPTAGLHFDHELLTQLQSKGIQIGSITLHIGAGTFKPVSVDQVAEHKMHYEYIDVSAETCDLINKTKTNGGRVIAVGTTTVRALESAIQGKLNLSPYSGDTNIFIYPGYYFRCIDGLITNFHLPKSSLLMLVCALGGYKNILSSYQVAIEKHYRFYSYGDAMYVPNMQKEKSHEV